MYSGVAIFHFRCWILSTLFLHPGANRPRSFWERQLSVLDFARGAFSSNKDMCFTTSAGQGEHKWKIMNYGRAYFHLSSVLKSQFKEKGFRELSNVK